MTDFKTSATTGVVVILIGVVVSAATWSPPATWAQDAGMGGGGSDKETSYALKEGERNLKFAFIPIPNYTTVLGFGLGLAATTFYKLDRNDAVTPPSSSTLFGFYAQNKTWVGAFVQQFYYKEDTWRGVLAGGRASINFQTYIDRAWVELPGFFLNFNSDSDFILLKSERRTWSDLFLGLKYRYWDVRTIFGSGDLGIPEDLRSQRNKYNGLGLTANYDGREHVFNSRAGYQITLDALMSRDWLGSARDYESFDLKGMIYHSLGDTTWVLAGRGAIELRTGDVPFEDQAVVGMRNLRGYSSGKYRADQVYTVEAEVRWNFYGRWGAVAFGGLGWAVDEFSQLSLSGTLPAIGLGGRFLMIKQYRINVRIDYARGKDDDGWYFMIGEAF